MPAPTADDVLDYLGDSSSWDAEAVEDAFDAEKAAQARVCRVPGDDEDWPADLAEALFRRVARNLAMRALPLGSQPTTSEVGVGTFRPGFDPEIRRLEGFWRKLVKA